MRNSTKQTLTVFFILLTGMIVLWAAFGRPAPMPDAFKDSLPLAEALEWAAERDKPVLVLATADWCMPCQHLKRGALRDERVVHAIETRTVPVYLDVTRPGGPDGEAAGDLNVRGLPAIILLRAGNEIARLEGDRSALELLSWLESRTQLD